ncbi:MAG: XRE family transcriptional regulator, partial [Anaerolineae bacterium]|nr:XRE family transcriptional regulator [Anaerolineae bacterium]
KEAKLSLKELSKQVGLTASFLSQVEREESSPSIESLRKISQALKTPIFYFLAEENSTSPVVRRNQRLKLQKPNSQLVFELLTPDLNSQMEAILFEQEPGGGNYALPPHQYTEEFIYVLQGQLEVKLDDDVYELGPGDTIYFEGPRLQSLCAIGDQTLKVIAVVTPPVL